MQRRFERRLILGWWAESALYLLFALLPAAGALVLAARGQDGLERYRFDIMAGRAAVAAAAPMVDAYCRDVAGRLAQAPRPEKCAPPAADSSPPRSSAAVMNAFAERLNLRYQALDGTLAGLTQSGVDWRVVSEGYAIDPDDATLKARLKEAETELDRVKEEAQSSTTLSRRFDRSALHKAVETERDAYAVAAKRPDWKAAGQALLRWASLIDGNGDAAAAKTVAYMLNAERLSERARQAQALVRHGGLLWLGWAGWLWLATQIGRRRVRPLATASLLLTAAVALAGAEQHWLDVRLPEAAYWIAGALAGLAALLDLLAAARGWSWADALPRRRAASPWLLPGWLLFVGIGWLLLADLSLHFHPRLRFLLVEHFAGVWGAVLLLGLMPLVASPLLGALAWLFGRAGAPSPAGRTFGIALLILLPGGAWLATGELGHLAQYHTGEAFKAVAVLYAAWFLLVRAPLLKGGGLTGDLAGRMSAVLPAGLALLAIAASFWISRDLGPLLVLLVCVLIWAGAFFGLRLMIAAFALAFGFLFLAGDFVSPVVAERVRSAFDPFSSKTDDLARLLWFQQEAPAAGFGLGNVPWCGYAAPQRCLGLPLQTQSDYTFTALMGLSGAGAWVVAALIGLWAIELMRSRWDTAIDPCALLSGPDALRDGFRAWLAVAFGTMVAVQLGVTVAGNLAWIPLSGLTMPYVSFGSGALVTMTGFFALLADKVVPYVGREHARA
jgi:cell division protein FtsW (lipid II flippase)